MHIVISGKAGSGKSTLAEALRSFWATRGMTAYRYSLATPIVRMAQAVGVVGKHYGIEVAAKDRRLLQALGDEWGNATDPLMWVKAANMEVNRITKPWEEKKLFYVVILERVCHPQQLAAWPGALKIRLNAPREVRKDRCTAWPENEAHASETALDNAKFDLTFDTSTQSVAEIVGLVDDHVRSKFNRG